MTKVLDDITVELARATLAVGASCAEYDRVMRAVADETAKVDELIAAERIAWVAHQALCGLSLKHETLLNHVRRTLLANNAPGWVNHNGNIFFDADALALEPATDD